MVRDHSYDHNAVPSATANKKHRRRLLSMLLWMRFCFGLVRVEFNSLDMDHSSSLEKLGRHRSVHILCSGCVSLPHITF